MGNQEGQILLVQRADSGVWLYPTGWADVGYSAAEVAVKEVREETGIEVEPVRLVMVLDGLRLGFTQVPLYSLVFHLRNVGGTLQAHPLECADVGWFSEDSLPSPLAGAGVWSAHAFAAIRGEPVDVLFDWPRRPVWRKEGCRPTLPARPEPVGTLARWTTTTWSWSASRRRPRSSSKRWHASCRNCPRARRPPIWPISNRSRPRPASSLLVARDASLGDRIVGSLTLVTYRIPTGLHAVIEDVVVDESARGHGVGTALTAEAARLARAQGAQARQLDVATVEGGGEPFVREGRLCEAGDQRLPQEPGRGLTASGHAPHRLLRRRGRPRWRA